MVSLRDHRHTGRDLTALRAWVEELDRRNGGPVLVRFEVPASVRELVEVLDAAPSETLLVRDVGA